MASFSLISNDTSNLRLKVSFLKTSRIILSLLVSDLLCPLSTPRLKRWERPHISVRVVCCYFTYSARSFPGANFYEVCFWIFTMVYGEMFKLAFYFNEEINLCPYATVVFTWVAPVTFTWVAPVAFTWVAPVAFTWVATVVFTWVAKSSALFKVSRISGI